jgi:peptide/nickel transport system ATP-binding protein
MSLLDVRDLVVEIPTGTRVSRPVNGVSLTVETGEILGILGESGAGKSLTGAAILGLLDPPARMAAGSIWLDGERLDTRSPAGWRHVRGRRIGLIVQDPLTALDPLYTIGQQLVETMRTHLMMSAREARQGALSWLERVGIPDPDRRIDSYPHELSGGQRQRVVIALALCSGPRLVVADEPTTALDVSLQTRILTLLRRLAGEQRIAVLLITHDIGVIAQVADQVAVMYAGRIVESGPVASVIRRPSHPYTEGLVASMPSLDHPLERLHQIDGTMPRTVDEPVGCAFAPRCPRHFARCWTERPPRMPVGDAVSSCWLHDRSPS